MKHPLLIWSSILVGLQILAGGAVLGDAVGSLPAGMFVLIVAALQGGTAFYTANQTVDASKVAALTSNGVLVAGPAAPMVDGSPVEVTATGGEPPVATDPDRDMHGRVDLVVVLLVVIAAAVLLLLAAAASQPGPLLKLG